MVARGAETAAAAMASTLALHCPWAGRSLRALRLGGGLAATLHPRCLVTGLVAPLGPALEVPQRTPTVVVSVR